MEPATLRRVPVRHLKVLGTRDAVVLDVRDEAMAPNLPVAAPGRGWARQLPRGALVAAGATGLAAAGAVATLVAQIASQDRHLTGPLAGFGIAAFISGCVLLQVLMPVQGDTRDRPGLRGRDLADVMREFCGARSPAGQFDWSAPELFANAMGADMRKEVSHILARAFTLARESQHAATAQALREYADTLATRADERAALASLVSDANAACDDRLGISLGTLLLRGAVQQVREPAAAPRDVVLTLALYAATRAINAEIAGLLGKNNTPTAELMLFGCHAVQSALLARGLEVPLIFHRVCNEAADLETHRGVVGTQALAIADVFCREPGAVVRPRRGSGVGIVRQLRQHAGTEFDEIIARRLAHRTAPLLEELNRRNEALEEKKLQMSTADYTNESSRQMAHYQESHEAIYAQAIDGALTGNTDDWVSPVQAELIADAAPGTAATPCGPGPMQAPEGYDPDKGKWQLQHEAPV